MKKFAVVLGLLAAAYAGAYGLVTFRIDQSHKAVHDQRSKIVALGRSVDAALRTPTLDELKQSCEGKLTPGTAKSIVTYAVPLDVKDRPDLDQQRVDGAIAGAWKNDSRVFEVNEVDPIHDQQVRDAYMPSTWQGLMHVATVETEDVAQLRYVAVTLFSSLSPASMPLGGDGSSFSSGSGTFQTQVITYPEGKPVCGGTGRTRMPEKVSGSGRSKTQFDADREAQRTAERNMKQAWIEGALASPLDDVCKAGGDSLCEVTASATGSR